MSLIELKERQEISENIKLSKIYVQLEKLVKELIKKELPHKIIKLINQDIEELNSISLIDNKFRKLIKQKQSKIIKLVEKELKIIPKNYYRNLWLSIGMSAFGLPIGVTFGLSVGNIGLLGIGLPIGMLIGIVIGLAMDKKTSEEVRQLDIEIKY
ncbi:hypothetical protein [Flavobacterium sp. 5]|uniref:hypothetical protein n=1 Tax=Flavobacterium sp. 5 TaxID=2035199 RepID=UPI000C2CBBF3|nr:hypothetical protein [Flavobacterium sp. 5]PKB15738.1 hypothetical protein CLU82_0828 [Flavobacterium sp. 5]